jgi:hypothetical protein
MYQNHNNRNDSDDIIALGVMTGECYPAYELVHIPTRCSAWIYWRLSWARLHLHQCLCQPPARTVLCSASPACHQTGKAGRSRCHIGN